MKLPAKLVERIAGSIADELLKKHIVEADDEKKFREDIYNIISQAIEEEKQLEEEAERLVQEHMEILESEEIRYRTAVMKVKEKLAEERNIHLEPEERLNQIAHRIKRYLETEPSVEIFEEPNKIRRMVHERLKEIVKQEKEIDKEVRSRIKSYSRKILEGTPEWKILYSRIYEDALRRRGLL
ncbi:hypothetical protein JCM14244_05800 [Venenivibrio stagnispumantis]|uniref:DUF507 family protein n=1 Tax=Venenivibrio stagnispumantis TaxID=407998 RepID=A0AA45WI95_9AQUI|nr:DUF507 family protein [Venenivibrio stagnispumantis]MCW4572751.1 DUF507 family protein [Venenivibrio stagnispumantis]SMP00294.1 hypothetical protein SAMN06264868_10139 [Venenivibrio stagnispumantis]